MQYCVQCSLYIMHTAVILWIHSDWVMFLHLQTEERSSHPQKSSHKTSLGFAPVPFSVAQLEQRLNEMTRQIGSASFPFWKSSVYDTTFHTIDFDKNHWKPYFYLNSPDDDTRVGSDCSECVFHVAYNFQISFQLKV